MEEGIRPSIADVDGTEGPQQKIYYRNRAYSSLLALPLEIRWRIFEFILKNKHIHIRERHGYNGKYFACLLEDWDLPPDYIRYHDSSSPFRAQLGLDNGIPRAPQTRPLIKLTPVWRTCRQIYHETAQMIQSETDVLSFEMPTHTSVMMQVLGEQLTKVTKLWVWDLFQVEKLCMLYLMQKLDETWVSQRTFTEIRILSREDQLRKTRSSSRGALDVRRRFDANAEAMKVNHMKHSLACLPTVVVQVDHDTVSLRARGNALVGIKEHEQAPSHEQGGLTMSISLVR